MKTKKITSIVLTCVLLMGMLVGCGTNQNAGKSEKAGTTSQKETIDNNNENASKKTSDKPVTKEREGGKILVVYYSATGSTGAVANTLAGTLNADIFELKPVEPYSNGDLDWTKSNSRVSKEYDNTDSRNVKLVATTVDDWNSYDTVLIGYPIWWGIAAWPVDGFVKSNDFTGKTVIPFCTSASSGLGDSGKLLAKMAANGKWLKGERFRSGASKADVEKWANGLGL